MSQNDQLIIPEIAVRDPDSFEILRLWIAENKQHISLRVGVWDEPAAWGLMLADLTRHIAESYRQDVGLRPEETVRQIKDAFNMEMEFPTDTISS